MKKALAGLVLAVVFIPNIAFAQVNPGVEFLTPLVQTIIHLLQDRIGELQGIITRLEARIAELESKPATVCVGAVAPAQPQQVVNPNQEKITSLKEQISAIDEKLLKLSQDMMNEQRIFDNLPNTTGVTAYEIEMLDRFRKENTYQKQVLQLQRDSLYKQMDLLR